MNESVEYDRAVGFFSSTVFSVAPREFCSFFERSGTLRLVCSPVLGAADLAAIHRALVEPAKAKADLPRTEDLIRRGESARAFSAWLASGQMTMQIALPSNGREGLYHEKIGVFTDKDKNRLAIAGSANESLTAWSKNFERVDIFPSWSSEGSNQRCWKISQAFEDLWRNRTQGLHVLPLQEAFLSGLLRVRPATSFAEGDLPRGLAAVSEELPPEILVMPNDIKLFTHQERAIEKWAAHNGRGIFALATGAGKTITALSLAARLSVGVKNLCILVIAPYIHLVDQWIENANRYGLRPIRAAEGKDKWEDDLACAINAINIGKRPILSIAATQATLTGSNRFKELLALIRVHILVIGDEVHNYGTIQVEQSLPHKASYRLGLSATPERHRDTEGTDRIVKYFGQIVERYTLSDAIHDEVLTPYRYFPQTVELEPDELEKYLAITKQLSRYMSFNEEEPSSDLAMRLLLKRARVVATARQKLQSLFQILSTRREDTHILVYCGDGQVEGAVPSEEIRQVAAAVDLIGNKLMMRCASYTAETPPTRRRELLELFASGEIQVLVAIRCLDEGVDIPSTRTAIILASSTNPRQFIQRRGRILRRSVGKNRADLFDLIVCPDLSDLQTGSSDFQIVRELLRREFQRASEFASLALNGPVARRELQHITEALQLHDGWNTND